MDKETLKKYRKAGEIAAKARNFGEDLIKEGRSYCEIVDGTEKKIKDLGGKPAFPVNLSINDIGAHDTADVNEKRAAVEGLVKLDVGVHIDGYIGDTATTVPLNTDKEKLLKASKEALERALGMIRPGVKISKISSEIEGTIKSFGYKPIRNLTGHGLGKYDLHAKTKFPNVGTDLDYKLEKGDVFAIEPFATDGSGKVIESSRAMIFKWQKEVPVRSREGRKILRMSKNDFDKLPFSKRWLKDRISRLRLNMSLRELTDRNALYRYPVLKEVDGGDISQAEHTVIVDEKPEITTKI